jgi:hypothetical protein
VTPQVAGQRVATIQQQAGLPNPLPVYVCWLGKAPPAGHGDNTPALPDAEHVERYISQAASQHTALAPQIVARSRICCWRANGRRARTGARRRCAGRCAPSAAALTPAYSSI